MTDLMDRESAAALEELRGELIRELRQQREELWGVLNADEMAELVDRFWSDNVAMTRVESLADLGSRPGDRILDVGSGSGHFVQYATASGYDCLGIEPDIWMLAFAEEKARATGLPVMHMQRRVASTGEALPFRDDSFDLVVSHQTLEHVQSPAEVIGEMIRVVKPGGNVYVHCPDYRGTFEGHYRLPWLPLFPRPLAKLFLLAHGRPLAGLRTIQYVTKPKVVRWVRSVARRTSWQLQVTDLHFRAYRAVRPCRSPLFRRVAFCAHRARHYIGAIGRREISINLLIHVRAK